MKLGKDQAPSQMALVAETDEAGRSWPHGERAGDTPRVNLGNTHKPFRPGLSSEMREYVGKLYDDGYTAGIARGKELQQAIYEHGEWVAFGLGALVGVAVYWLISRIGA
jgi:hypothetical protein